MIDKEENWTSRDVCNKISHIFSTKKVGHSGTLDPFATGLLIVALGKATKALNFLKDEDKTYIASIFLGKKTSTGDYLGEFKEEKEVPLLNKKVIENTLFSFLGESEQLPPMTSAIHVNGEKLYTLAHKGIEINRPKRKIYVKEISLIEFKENIITYKVKVSPGTYIRTLSEDIAEKLHTLGYLKSLRRVNIGNFSLTNAKKILEIKEQDLLSVYDVLSIYYPILFLDEKEIEKVKNGMNLHINKNDEFLLICNKNKVAIAIYRRFDNNLYKVERGLF